MRGGLFSGPARFQPSHRRQPPEVPPVERAVLPGQEGFRADGNRDIESAPRLHAEEAGWRHADHFKRMPVERQLPSHGRGFGGKLPLPETVADHRPGTAAAAGVVGGRKHAAQNRTYT